MSFRGGKAGVIKAHERESLPLFAALHGSEKQRRRPDAHEREGRDKEKPNASR